MANWKGRSYTKSARRLGGNNWAAVRCMPPLNQGFKLSKRHHTKPTIGRIQSDYLTKHKKKITLPHVSILDKED